MRLHRPRPHPDGKQWPYHGLSCDEECQAIAVAWYLLDPGAGSDDEEAACYRCRLDFAAPDGDRPFPECFVPQDMAAMGACTNCWYWDEGQACSHRRDGSSVNLLRALTDGEIEAMSDEELGMRKRKIIASITEGAEGGGLGAERAC